MCIVRSLFDFCIIYAYYIMIDFKEHFQLLLEKSKMILKLKFSYDFTKWITKWTKWLGIFGKESHYLNTNFEETRRA